MDAGPPAEGAGPPLRADAERNRRRILDAAREAFAEEGLEVGVDSIARRAGVGVGTLYRRFPTKQALVCAVLEDRVQLLLDAIAAVAPEVDAWTAFARTAEVLAASIARDRSLYDLFQRRNSPMVGPDARRRVAAAIGPVLERAQAAGVVRPDVVVGDVPALCGVAARLPAWRLERQPELWRRYLAISLDGLRAGAARELPHPPPLAWPDPGAEVPAPLVPVPGSA